MAKFRTHYDNLQVSRAASDAVIRAAFRSLSQKYHPDKNPHDRENAERIMKTINAAYEVLSDPTKRYVYDERIRKNEKRAAASAEPSWQEATSARESRAPSPTQAPPPPPHPPAFRPGVLSISIREKSALYAAYMPFFKVGGLFIPTNKAYKVGEEVFMLLTLMDDPTKHPVSGKVVWITPTGVGVQFQAGESGQQARNKIARNKIEDLLGGT